MNRALAVALLASAGCRGLEPLRPDEIRDVLTSIPAPEGPYVRLKVRLSVDSLSFAGVFDGVVMARIGSTPAVRAQFFPDVGGKVLDLLARPDRITGYFPMGGDGIDLALPGEARLHLISLIGVTLLEHAAPLTESRILGRRGSSIEASGTAPGVTLRISRSERTFVWLHGISWSESATRDAITIGSSRLSAKIDILQRERLDNAPDSLFELRLPPEIRR